MAKRISTRNLTSIATQGLGVYAGIAAGKALTSNVPQLAENPIFGIVAQLAGAVVLSGSRGALMKNVAAGMAANAAGQAVNTLAPNLAQQIGIAGIGAGGSFALPGVAGGRLNGLGAYNYRTPMVRVQ